MAEAGIRTEIVTPAGTLVFNDRSGPEYNYFSDVEGMDAAAIKREDWELGGRDGAVVPDGFRAALYPSFSGYIVANSLASRRVQADRITAYLHSLARADGTLKWLPSGAAAMRQRTVRLHDGPTVKQGHRIDGFQFSLVAGDPLAYSVTLQTSADIAANGAAVNITNAGNAPTWPTIRIYGASTNPIVKNNTTGKRVEFDYNGGLVIPDGTYLEVDTRKAQAILVSTGASQIGSLDPLTSEFFQLAVGVNAIEFDVTSPGANSKVVVLHRDGYWG